jgi:hypothetical protein
VKRSERGFDGPDEADAPAAPDDVECWSTLSRLSLPDLAKRTHWKLTTFHYTEYVSEPQNLKVKDGDFYIETLTDATAEQHHFTMWQTTCREERGRSTAPGADLWQVSLARLTSKLPG